VIPERVPNHVDGEDVPAASGEWLDKHRPADGSLLCRAARSGAEDVGAAVAAARRAQPAWAERTVVSRGEVCRELALALREHREELSEVVAAETGKPLELARGETDAAIEMGFFVAGEGRRYYGRTTTASMEHRTVMAVRQPVGVAGLLISFNTPLPNVAWKVFPAILCGNACVLKPSEETPASAYLLATLCCKVGLPAGVLNVVQGLGSGAGAGPVGVVRENRNPQKPASLYERLARAERDDVLVFGHTHQPWVHEYGGVLFVNCGSVGKPKDGDPRGAFILLFRRVPLFGSWSGHS